MPKHALPPTGGGYPVACAAARPVSPYDRKEVRTITLTLSTDAEAEAKGRRVVELIREACIARDMERIAILHVLFRSIVCRVPEFHIVVYEVIERNDDLEMARLFDFPRKGRGRRPGDKCLLHGVDRARDGGRGLRRGNGSRRLARRTPK